MEDKAVEIGLIREINAAIKEGEETIAASSNRKAHRITGKGKDKKRKEILFGWVVQQLYWKREGITGRSVRVGEKE